MRHHHGDAFRGLSLLQRKKEGKSFDNDSFFGKRGERERERGIVSTPLQEERAEHNRTRGGALVVRLRVSYLLVAINTSYCSTAAFGYWRWAVGMIHWWYI